MRPPFGAVVSRQGPVADRSGGGVVASTFASAMARRTRDSGSADPSGGVKAPREPLPKGFMVIWSTIVVDMIGFGIAIPVLGPYVEDRFGSTLGQHLGFYVSLLGASFSLAQWVVAPLLGRLSDRIGRKPVIVMSLLGTAVASVITGAANAFWIILLARFFDGASGASMGVAQAAVADMAPPRRRAALMGMVGAAFGIGFTVGPAIGALASRFGGRRAPFYVAGALALINAVAAIIRMPETRGMAHEGEVVAEPTGPSTLARTWRDNGLPKLLAVSLVATFAFSAFEQVFTIFGKRGINGFTQESAGWAFVIVGIVVSIVQGGLVGPALKKVGELSLLRIGLTLTAVGMAVLAATSGWLLLVPSLILLSAGQGFSSPTMTSAVSNRIDPDKRGALMGVEQSWNSLARVLGPLAGGLAFDRIGISAPFVANAVLFSVALVLTLGITRTAGDRVGRGAATVA